MTEQLANLAVSTLDGAHDASTTTISVVDASAFPATGTFRVVIDPGGADELCTVSAVSGNDLTVTRGAEGSTAASHASGVDVAVVLTAAGLGVAMTEAADQAIDAAIAADQAIDAAIDAVLGAAYIAADHVVLTDTADYFPAATSTTQTRPTSMTTLAGSISWTNSGSQTAAEQIDEPTLNVGDYISMGSGASCALVMDDFAADPTSDIVGVTVHAYMTTGPTALGSQVALRRTTEGDNSATVINVPANSGSGWKVSSQITTNPFTGLPWTVADIDNLGLYIHHDNYNVQNVYSVYIDVEYAPPTNAEAAIATLAEDRWNLTARDEVGDVIDTDTRTLRFPDGTVVNNGLGSVSIREVPTGVIGCALYKGSTQSIPNATQTTITGWTAERDDGGFFDAGASDRMTVPAGMGGWYVVGGDMSFAYHGSGVRVLSLGKNGSTDGNWAKSLGGTEAQLNGSQLVYLAAGDYVRMEVYQSSGGSLNVPEFGSASRSGFWMYKLGSGTVGESISVVALRTAAQSIPSATWTAVSFDGVRWDSDGYWSSGTDLTIPAGLGGKYDIRPYMRFASNTSGYRYVRVKVNGSQVGSSYSVTASVQGGNGPQLVFPIPYDLAAGDVVTVDVYQDSGSAKDVTGEMFLSLLATQGAGLSLDTGVKTLLARPTVSETEDDDFSASALDAKWLAYTGDDATMSLSAGDGWALCTSGGIKLQAVPGGGWSEFEAEFIAPDYLAAAYQNIGLVLTNGDTAASSTDARWGIGGDNGLGTKRFVAEKFVNGSYSSTYQQHTGLRFMPQRYRLRITHSGTTYNFDYAFGDGGTWTRYYSTSSLGFTPTHFGFRVDQTAKVGYFKVAP